MSHYRAFKVSCLLLMWTGFDYGSTLDARTVVELARFPGAPGVPTTPLEDFNEQLEETGKEIDATVRNFFPVKGKQKWMRREFPPVTEMLFFNISVIGDNEEVTLARLHLHRKRLPKTHVNHQNHQKKYLPSPYRVVLYQVQPDLRRSTHEDTRTMKLASLPVSHLTKGGWHALDVTAVVREILINAQGPSELLLGIHFESPKRLAKPHSPLVPLKHFLRSPGIPVPEHPHGASSCLVVFSEKDPYFEDFEEDETPPTSNLIPISRPGSLPNHSFKERHLKHKMSKGKGDNDAARPDPASNVVGRDSPIGAKAPPKPYDNRSLWKHDKAENEVLKSDVIRHRGKHRKSEVRRSKLDELALKQRTELKSLPFLHANEVEEIRQTSRRLTRSSGPPEASRRQRRRPGYTEKKPLTVDAGGEAVLDLKGDTSRGTASTNEGTGATGTTSSFGMSVTLHSPGSSQNNL